MKKAFKTLLLICLAAALAILISNPDIISPRPTGWVETDGQFYYYNEQHQMLTGWLQQDDGVYYLNEDGVRHSGWLEEGGKRHYFDEYGLMVNDGWLDIDGQRWFILDTSAVSGLQTIDGRDYFFGEDGCLVRDGWITIDDRRRFIVDCTAVSGLQSIDGRNYYFGEDGCLVTGWVDLEDGRWYFDPAEGHSLTGIQTIDGVTYGFTVDGPLAPQGWFELDDRTYYIDENGSPIPGGWQKIEDTTYYFDTDGSLFEGWAEVEGHTYYMKDGLYTTGILALDGRNYFFDSRGWNILMVNPWNTVPEGYEVQTTSVGGDHYIAKEAAGAFSNMIYAMQQLELGPIITSSYRTITRQQEIFDERMAGYMEQGMTEEEAYALTATSVAIPGTSEHQLGLAMDMTDAFYNKLDEGQMETPTQLWLIENSWKYGFILRYPDGKSEITGIIYEPWHYRYVGKELAAELKELNLTMEEYLDQLTEDKSLTASNPANGNTMK